MEFKASGRTLDPISRPGMPVDGKVGTSTDGITFAPLVRPAITSARSVGGSIGCETGAADEMAAQAKAEKIPIDRKSMMGSKRMTV